MLASLTSSFFRFTQNRKSTCVPFGRSAPSCVTFGRGAAHLPTLRLGATQLTYLRHVWALTFPVLRHHFLTKISLDVEKKFKDASLGRPFGPPSRRFR